MLTLSVAFRWVSCGRIIAGLDVAVSSVDSLKLTLVALILHCTIAFAIVFASFGIWVEGYKSVVHLQHAFMFSLFLVFFLLLAVHGLFSISILSNA